MMNRLDCGMPTIVVIDRAPAPQYRSTAVGVRVVQLPATAVTSTIAVIIAAVVVATAPAKGGVLPRSCRAFVNRFRPTTGRLLRVRLLSSSMWLALSLGCAQLELGSG